MSSSPFLCRSTSQRWPKSSRESLSTLSNFEGLRNTIVLISSFCPNNVIVHWHEENPSFEVRRSIFNSVVMVLSNLVENSQRCESWDIFPLDFPPMFFGLLSDSSVRSRRSQSVRSERRRWISAMFDGPTGFPQAPLQRPRSRTVTVELGGRSACVPCPYVELTVHCAVSPL